MLANKLNHERAAHSVHYQFFSLNVSLSLRCVRYVVSVRADSQWLVKVIFSEMETCTYLAQWLTQTSKQETLVILSTLI